MSRIRRVSLLLALVMASGMVAGERQPQLQPGRDAQDICRSTPPRVDDSRAGGLDVRDAGRRYAR